jgi:cyclophilin family peptidyl-prolyl cis-trans isomerase
MKIRWLIVCVLALGIELQAGVLARFKMSGKLNGTIDVELYEDKPATLTNFFGYVRSGAWHDCIYHRWVSNFVLQGGSKFRPFTPSYLEPVPKDASGNLVDNSIPVARNPPIPFEANIGRHFSNVYGTIAMARVGTDVNSATTDWFFNLKDNLNLDTQDGGYTVFGALVRGTNTLNLFKSAGGSGQPPLFIDGGVYNWIHTDITLLTAAIVKVPEGLAISWETVEGVPNVLEFTRTIPPVWEAVQTVTGDGAGITITNDPGSDVMRQYRVRIDFPK